MYVAIFISFTSLVAHLIKNLPAMWETWVQSLGWEDPLEKGKAIHSCIVHEVTKSGTGLSGSIFTFHFHSSVSVSSNFSLPIINHTYSWVLGLN